MAATRKNSNRRGGSGRGERRVLLGVDDLQRFRRRRLSAKPPDTLGLLEGRFAHLKTEYKRRYIRRSSDYFKNVLKLQKPSDALKVEGEFEFLPEYREKFIPLRGSRPLSAVPKPQLTVDSKDPLSTVTETLERYTPQEIKRRHLTRKPTNLKPEGELLVKYTETREKFIYYPGAHRPSLIRKTTNLKLEGEREIRTEVGERFIAFPVQEKPVIVRHKDQVTVGTDPLSLVTETLDKYVPYTVSTKALPIKKAENLHAGDDMWYQPEYKENFVEFPMNRTLASPPEDHLKPDGEVASETELNSNYLDFPRERTIARPHVTHLKMEGGFLAATEQSEFRNFPRERRIAKPHCTHLKQEGDFENTSPLKSNLKEFSRSRNIAKPHEAHLKLEGEVGKETELKSEFRDFPRQRPTIHRTNTQLKTEGDFATDTTNKLEFIDFHHEKSIAKPLEDHIYPEGGFENSTEIKSQFVDFHPERKIAKPLDHLKPEGEVEKTSEVKAKFVTFETDRNIVRPHGSHFQTEGEMFSTTEASEYRDIPRSRPVLHRTKSELRPGGSFEDNQSVSHHEYTDLPRTRPILPRPATHIRLEGEIHAHTENSAYFRDMNTQRPTITRRSPLLTLEGQITLKPEYEDQFRNFPRARPSNHRIHDHLRYGDYEYQTGSLSKAFTDDKPLRVIGIVSPTQRPQRSRSCSSKTRVSNLVGREDTSEPSHTGRPGYRMILDPSPATAFVILDNDDERENNWYRGSSRSKGQPWAPSWSNNPNTVTVE